MGSGATADRGGSPGMPASRVTAGSLARGGARLLCSAGGPFSAPGFGPGSRRLGYLTLKRQTLFAAGGLPAESLTPVVTVAV